MKFEEIVIFMINRGILLVFVLLGLNATIRWWLLKVAARAGAHAGAQFGANTARKTGASAGARAGAKAGGIAGAIAGAKAAEIAAADMVTQTINEGLKHIPVHGMHFNIHYSNGGGASVSTEHETKIGSVKVNWLNGSLSKGWEGEHGIRLGKVDVNSGNVTAGGLPDGKAVKIVGGVASNKGVSGGTSQGSAGANRSSETGFGEPARVEEGTGQNITGVMAGATQEDTKGNTGATTGEATGGAVRVGAGVQKHSSKAFTGFVEAVYPKPGQDPNALARMYVWEAGGARKSKFFLNFFLNSLGRKVG